MSEFKTEDAWTLVYDDFNRDQHGLREALCTLGNGYFCTRGALAFHDADDVNYPGTYMAGLYNRLDTPVAERVITNEDLVNIPNWLPVSFRIGKGDWFSINAGELLSYRQVLNMKAGLLTTDLRHKDRDGHITRVVCARLVHMDQPHIAAQELTVTPENWSGPMEVRSTLDGHVINGGVKRYLQLAHSHLVSLEGDVVEGERSGAELVSIGVETSQSRVRIGMAARVRIYDDGKELDPSGRTKTDKGFAEKVFKVEAREGRPIVVDKVIAIYNSRDTAISEPVLAAREAVDRADDFETLAESQAYAWHRLWRRCDIQVQNDTIQTQMVLRLHIFHQLQTLSHNTIDLDAGVPARGWHGEAYRGHVFWDELFILPFINYRIPALSRAMLRYRFNRIGKAREAAKDNGFRGAMFPWQSGSDGREESQIMHLNPRSGRWLPDNTLLQRHVGLTIAYNAWQYYQVTGDKNFLMIRGAELIIEVARFFASLATFDAEQDRYEIKGVMGPDEYHDGYPDSDAPGLNNNAYTNVLVSWLMETATKVIGELDAGHKEEILTILGVSESEFKTWDAMSRKLKICFHDDGIISQFEGYGDLEEFDWDGYRKKYGDIQRLDRILEAEGDSANRYKLSKQADVLMLFYLFSLPKLKARFERLGYDFGEDQWQRNVDYYMARTSHGSTLSYLTHSWVQAKSNPEMAWQHFTHALYSDITDIQGGTTAEGIHLGAMAGTVDLVQRCFTGLDIRDGKLHFEPVLQDRLTALKFSIRFQGHWLDLDIRENHMTIHAHRHWTKPVQVCVKDTCVSLKPGKTHTFDL